MARRFRLRIPYGALLAAALAGLTMLAAGGAHAAAPAKPAQVTPLRPDAPAFYQADHASYDNATGIVMLAGHVTLWQNQTLLTADRVTYDRCTGVAAASGHVVLMEPDGQTLFATYAELSGGMKDGVLKGMRALLPQNGRLAANGARRIGGTINELSRAIYSTCNLCRKDPTRPPLGAIRARTAVQDTQHHMIEYRDAVIDVLGVPVMWLPYLTHPDPTQRRASGLLVPNFGYSKRLGAFFAQPYFWVINKSSDATLTPLLATANGPGLGVQYRQRFNNGQLRIDAQAANDAGHVFASGRFALNSTWRWGFDLNRASSLNYLRDYRVADSQNVLTSRLYLEGFGAGAYARLDSRAYQGLSSSVRTDELPYVLPHAEYDFVSGPNVLGGRVHVQTDAFNVLRYQGTTTQRGRLSLGWTRPAIDRLGEVWKLSLQLDSAAYVAHQFDQQPNYGATTAAYSAQAMPTAALEWRLPLLRNAGAWGTQLIEPIAQVVVATQGGSYLTGVTQIPNEDSLAPEFTDANLFALNRFPGVDRLEGGLRANVALHANWTLPSGALIDGFVGQGWRLHKDTAFPTWSGLRDTTTDIVSRLTVTPPPWLDLTTRQRFDHRSDQIRFADALASVGSKALRVTGGYIFSTVDPYLLYLSPPSTPFVLTPRSEITLGASTKQGNWRLSVNAQRDLTRGKMVSLGVGAGYENNCLAFDVSFYRRYTSINNDNGASTVLFQITLKSVGEFGFHAF